MDMKIGTRIYFAGDVSVLTRQVSSEPAQGTIIGMKPTERWGQDYLVRLDDGRKMAVPPSSFETAQGQRKFWPLTEWQETANV